MLSIFASVWLVLCLPAAYGLGMLQPFASLARWPSTADMMDYATTRLGRKHQRCSPENVRPAVVQHLCFCCTPKPADIQLWDACTGAHRAPQRPN